MNGLSKIEMSLNMCTKHNIVKIHYSRLRFYSDFFLFIFKADDGQPQVGLVFIPGAQARKFHSTIKMPIYN